MALPLYKTITTSPATTTLIAQNSTTSGNVNKILISNFSDNAAAADFYFFKNVNIPKGATMVLDDNLNFDSAIYSLIMYSTGTSPALTVMIK